MKIEKNKIIFIGMVVVVLGFIVGYGIYVMNTDEDEAETLLQPMVPDLGEEPKEYSSKLEAIQDIKEERAINAPSIYSESLLDSMGMYDPMLEEKERQRIVDSIYATAQISYDKEEAQGSDNPRTQLKDSQVQAPRINIDFAARHETFFEGVEAIPEPITTEVTSTTDPFILVEVNGEQTVRNDERLELRLAVEATIQGVVLERNTLVYGFTSFKANRIYIEITNIQNNPVHLKAYDLLDGNEGIYIRNSITAQAKGEVIGDIVDDVNIPGVPQVGGIKQVFKRNQRNVKATIFNQYQLLLKPGE